MDGVEACSRGWFSCRNWTYTDSFVLEGAPDYQRLMQLPPSVVEVELR